MTLTKKNNTPYKDREIPKDLGVIVLEPIINQKIKVKVKCKYCNKEYYLAPQVLFRLPKIKSCSDCSYRFKIKGYEDIGGLRQHPAYNILDSMKRRCYNKNEPAYKYYGAVGIKICDEWKNNYLSFCKWADENGFIKGETTIDRIDCNGDYTPENCRLIPFSKQIENKHIQRNSTTGYTGVSLNKKLKKYESYIDINGKRIRFGLHKTAEDAYKARLKYMEKNSINYKREKWRNKNEIQY